jgi:hypothetical protein
MAVIFCVLPQLGFSGRAGFGLAILKTVVSKTRDRTCRPPSLPIKYFGVDILQRVRIIETIAIYI